MCFDGLKVSSSLDRPMWSKNIIDYRQCDPRSIFDYYILKFYLPLAHRDARLLRIPEKMVSKGGLTHDEFLVFCREYNFTAEMLFTGLGGWHRDGLLNTAIL